MKQTAFWREKNGEYRACLKYSVKIFVEKLYKMQRLEVICAVRHICVVRRQKVKQKRKYLLTYLLTYSVVQSASWEANWFVASQEIPLIVKKPNVHYHTHKCGHLSLSWVTPIQSTHPQPNSWKSILILSTHLRLCPSSGFFPSGFPTKTLYAPLLTHTRHMPSPSHSWFYQPHSTSWAVQII